MSKRNWSSKKCLLLKFPDKNFEFISDHKSKPVTCSALSLSLSPSQMNSSRPEVCQYLLCQLLWRPSGCHSNVSIGVTAPKGFEWCLYPALCGLYWVPGHVGVRRYIVGLYWVLGHVRLRRHIVGLYWVPRHAGLRRHIVGLYWVPGHAGVRR